MLAILFSWIILSIILFLAGDATSLFYNKLCKQTESYSIIDKVILGLSFLILPLSLWSLWLPSNHYFLFIVILILLIYYFYKKKRINNIIYSLIYKFKKNPISFHTFFTIFLFILLSAITWEEGVFDSLFYHLQNIRWNEEYAIIPGLGNLDDHFAFNSNYLLISSIFTFRFLFGEAIYPLQSFFIVVIMLWILYELYSSHYEIKRFIILATFAIFYILSIRFMLNTSTDILPNLIIFYTISKYILYSDSLNKNFLYLLIMPVFVVTSKLSMFAFLFISLYIFILYIKEKNYKPLIMSIIPLCIISIWLIRNIIISGYLIYPLPEIDLFSFDWKIPKEIAIQQKEYIHNIGYIFLKIAVFDQLTGFRDALWMNFFITGTYTITIISMVIFAFKFITKRKSIHFAISLFYLILIITLCIWLINGPDSRFITSIICSFIAIGFSILFNNKHIYIPRISKIVICSFFIIIGSWTYWRIYDRYKMIVRWETMKEKRAFSSFFLRPYSYYHFYESFTTESIENHYTPYLLNNNITIYISTVSNFTYDKLPATVKRNGESKLSNYKCLEARGNKVQDGFKAKENCK